MKTLKVLHIPDMHLDSKYMNKIQPSLDQILKYCSEDRINAVIIPGDIWHCKQIYSSSSAVPALFNFLRNLSNLVDFIFITKGNHDEPGSIALLHQLESNIYAYEYPVVLEITNEYRVKDLLREKDSPGIEFPKFIISLIPYPSKSGFITNTSIDNNNADFLEKFEQIFELIGDVTQPYTCPKILGFHGNVVGSRLSTGQTLVSQDIMVAPSTLEKAKHDYYTLNHIHLRQEIKPNMVYAGGLANFNWGETEQKSFDEICFDNTPFDNSAICREIIPLKSARPMIKLEAEFDSEVGFITLPGQNDNINPINSEIRYRVKVKENDRPLITEEKINDLKRCFEKDGNEIKIEFNIVPTERESRSEQIMQCKTLLDEVIEYAVVSNQEISESIKQKVLSLQESEVFS